MVHGLPLLFLALKTYVKPILIGNNIRKKLRFSEITQWKIQCMEKHCENHRTEKH